MINLNNIKNTFSDGFIYQYSNFEKVITIVYFVDENSANLKHTYLDLLNKTFLCECNEYMNFQIKNGNLNFSKNIICK